MTLRVKLLAYVVALHLALATTTGFLLFDHREWLLAAEALFLLSGFVAWRLVRAFTVPLELVRTGSELIEERDFTSHFTPVGQPEVDRLIEVYNRMIDQLREERLRVREQNELLDRIVEVSPGGVLICDFKGRISELNPSAETLLDVTRGKAIGRPLATLGSTLARALSALDIQQSRVVSMRGGRRVKCQRADFHDHGFRRSFFLLAELTEELRQSEKAAYEKLIRMMSHEVNNSVGAIGSLLDSLRGDVQALPSGERPEVSNALDVAATRLDHLRSFTDGFADVVRLPPPERRACDVAKLVDDLVVLLAPSMAARRIELVRNGAATLGLIELDKNQIEQALLNIVKNAAEAIGEDGTITLRLGQSDGRAWLEIEDTGAGLTPEADSQLFTPFFTTKDDGCGLGLTLVKEVLTRHGFTFSLENATPRGARFRIEL